MFILECSYTIAVKGLSTHYGHECIRLSLISLNCFFLWDKGIVQHNVYFRKWESRKKNENRHNKNYIAWGGK